MALSRIEQGPLIVPSYPTEAEQIKMSLLSAQTEWPVGPVIGSRNVDQSGFEYDPAASEAGKTSPSTSRADTNKDETEQLIDQFKSVSIHDRVVAYVGMLKTAKSKYKLSIKTSKLAKGGYGLIAEENIPAGVDIFTKTPMAYAQHSPIVPLACDYCLAVPGDLQLGHQFYWNPCKSASLTRCTCKAAWFCNTQCKVKALQDFHLWECKFAKENPAYRRWDSQTRMLFRIVGKLTYGHMSKDDLAQLFALEAKPKIAAAAGKPFAAARRSADSIMPPNMKRASPISREELTELLLRVQINQAVLSTTAGNELGLFIDPLFAMINNECWPNAFMPECDGGILRLRSRKPILKGEEITVAYQDITMNVIQRRERLARGWSFECMCQRCLCEMHHKPNPRDICPFGGIHTNPPLEPGQILDVAANERFVEINEEMGALLRKDSSYEVWKELARETNILLRRANPPMSTPYWPICELKMRLVTALTSAEEVIPAFRTALNAALTNDPGSSYFMLQWEYLIMLWTLTVEDLIDEESSEEDLGDDGDDAAAGEEETVEYEAEARLDAADKDDDEAKERIQTEVAKKEASTADIEAEAEANERENRAKYQRLPHWLKDDSKDVPIVFRSLEEAADKKDRMIRIESSVLLHGYFERWMMAASYRYGPESYYVREWRARFSPKEFVPFQQIPASGTPGWKAIFSSAEKTLLRRLNMPEGRGLVRYI